MNNDELKIQLKKYFGFATFKGLQESVILNVLKKEDSLLLCQLVVVNHSVINCQH